MADKNIQMTQRNATNDGWDNLYPKSLIGNITGLETALDNLKPLRFTNTAVTTGAWSADATYSGYGFRASITLSGCLATMIPEVIFAPTDADSGNFCSVAESYNGGVYIYAKTAPTATVTIPTITLEKAV